jgi:hypothetical protein
LNGNITNLWRLGEVIGDCKEKVATRNTMRWFLQELRILLVNVFIGGVRVRENDGRVLVCLRFQLMVDPAMDLIQPTTRVRRFR